VAVWSILVIWYIFPVLVCCTKKNLAALAKRIEENKLSDVYFALSENLGVIENVNFRVFCSLRWQNTFCNH
jgi:hypothetical protein